MCSVLLASGYKCILATSKIMALGWRLVLIQLKETDFFSSGWLVTLFTPWETTYYLFIPVNLKSTGKHSNNLQSFLKGDTSGTANLSSV